MNYNFGVLNDKEFEALCKDLLEADLAIKLQLFKAGKDQGTDLRYAGEYENEIIVQVKHYWNSKYANLKHDLTNKELPKVAAMLPKPRRYIVCTSLKLSAQESKEIVSLLKPFVKNSQDIYGYDRLAALLSTNEAVERKYYKLWLTSTSVISRILNNGIYSHSEFYEEKIIEKVGLYVKTRNYGLAKSKLLEHQFLIIKGEPGIGKTTLAYILLCDFMAEGFELVYVIDKLIDADGIITKDPNKKQIIFFDDFLGSNLYDIKQPRNAESHIVNFIDRIRRLKNKYLILTTRTTILKQATHTFDKFRKADQTAISNYEINLKDYSLLNKAHILYNHLYQMGVSPEEYDVFIKNKNYLKIIQHKNYSPRLIEFITKMSNFQQSGMESLEKFIFFNLDNPEEIWRHAYDHQLTEEDKLLLTSLFSLGGYNVAQEILEKVFEARYEYEIHHHNFQYISGAFLNTIRRLLDGFMVSVKDGKTGLNSFSFINPSVGDFLLSHFRADKNEKWRILNCVVFTDQFHFFFDPKEKKHIHFEPKEKQRLFKLFNECCNKLQTIEQKSVALAVIEIYDNYFKEDVTTDQLATWLNQYTGEFITDEQYTTLLRLIYYSAAFEDLSAIVNDNWDIIINDLYSTAYSASDFSDIYGLFAVYAQDFDKYIEVLFNFEQVEKAIHERFNTRIDDYDFSNEVDNLHSHSDFDERYEASKRISDRIEDMFTDYIAECNLDRCYDDLRRGLDWDSMEIVDNLIANRKHREFNKKELITAKDRKESDPYDEINRLFER